MIANNRTPDSKRHWWAVGAWIVCIAVLLPSARDLESRLDVAATIDGAEYVRVAAMLDENFQSAFSNALILVISGVKADAALKLEQLIDRVDGEVRKDPAVRTTLSYRDTADRLLLGNDGESAVVFVGLTSGTDRGADLDVVSRLRRRTDALVAALSPAAPGVSLRWTGEAALNADLRRIAAAEAQQAEMYVLPLVAVVLLLAFRTVIAALLPIGIGVITVPLALGAASLLANQFSLSIILINIVTMLGLGLSIDYALLMVGRFREELAKGADATTAARISAATAGRTVLLSGGTVAVGLCALLMIPINEIWSIAAGGLIVLVVSILAATTVVPIVLRQLGSRVNTLSVQVRSRADAHPRWWAAWGGIVFAHPRLLFAIAAVPLVLLALQSLRIDISLPRGNWLPASAQSVAAIRELETAGRKGLVQTVNVLLTLPAGLTLADEAGWHQLASVSARLEQQPEVMAVRSIATGVTGAAPWSTQAGLPRWHVDNFVSRDGRQTLLVLIPESGVEAHELSQLVRRIRHDLFPRDATGASVLVGGIPALNADYEDTVRDYFPGVAGFVVFVTIVLLALGYRSVVLPVKAVLLNILSVAAACGALVVVFQDGIGVRWLGLASATGGVFPNVPLIVFGIVFGLSMDYEVFLFNRVREAHLQGLDDRAAMTVGLSTTAGAITNAAVIMILVFIAFIRGEFVLIKMLGFSLAAAIFIDVTLVRLVLGPALFALLGKANWWPETNMPRPITSSSRAEPGKPAPPVCL